MKKTIIVCVAVLVCISVLIMTDKLETKKEYREQYFSNKDDFIKISELVIKHYESNDLEGRMSIWCSGEEAKVFYDEPLNDDIKQTINTPFEQSELDDIYDFIHGSRYECVEINEDFVEFGNSTGSISIYFSRTREKPERISKNHSMVNMGDGWFCSRSTAR